MTRYTFFDYVRATPSIRKGYSREWHKIVKHLKRTYPGLNDSERRRIALWRSTMYWIRAFRQFEKENPDVVEQVKKGYEQGGE